YLLDALPSLDLEQPLYILELATGSGTFSFYAMRALRSRLASLPQLAGFDWRYVMTDFTESTVSAWDAVSSFAELRAEGRVESAVFWPEVDERIPLRGTGTVLAPTTNPTVVVANYFFDSIRSDCFRIRNGELLEARYATVVDDAVRPDARHPFRGTSHQVTY